jgi:hypothetical protein
MTRVGISVEGQTEEEFIKRIIGPHLADRGVYAYPKIVTTKTVISGPNHKGGSVSFDKVVSEVRRLIDNHDLVTTFYDFYGFQGRSPGESVDDLEGRIAASINQPDRFRPYVQLHEFEGLIFSGPDEVGQLAEAAGREIYLRDTVQLAVNACGEPELVNDSPETAPSKRLTAMFQQAMGRKYVKVRDGVRLVERIGLAKVRAACPRFNGWLAALEATGGS